MLLLLKTFEECGVYYLIVRGFAVNWHGYKCTTGDIDFYLKDNLGNRANPIKAFAMMGYVEIDMLITSPIIARYCEIMMDDGIYTDLMTDISGLEKRSLMSISEWH